MRNKCYLQHILTFFGGVMAKKEAKGKKDNKEKKPIEGYYLRPDGLYEKGMTINGKRVRFRGQDPKEVLQKIAAYREKETTGRKFKDVAEDWLPHYETQVTYNTYYKQLCHYNRVTDFFGDMYIKDITPQDVNRFYLLMQSKKYSKKTIEHSRTTLSNILRYALVNGEITALASENVPIPKAPKTKRELPADHELRTIYQHAGTSNIALLAFFIVCTGCRRGEAVALQYKDIDFEAKKIDINKSVYFVQNKPQFKDTKTYAGNRTVPLLNVLVPFLPKGSPNAYIFSTDGKTPYTNSQLTKWYKAYQQQTGITATLHQLRHAYATILYESNIDVKLAQTLMGHADVSTTQNIYTHIRLSKLDDAAQKLNSSTILALK